MRDKLISNFGGIDSQTVASTAWLIGIFICEFADCIANFIIKCDISDISQH